MANAISDKCAEIMMSNIRPKAEPIIIAKSTNSDGTIKEIVWQAKDIKNLTFKSEIDPIGRTLPYMELVWTEIYDENKDFESTKKYLSANRYMEVSFSVAQSLGFYNNWKILYNNGTKWKDLFNAKNTWKQLKNDVQKEIITFPVLFLEDKPKIDGSTITWTARDFLYFLDTPISMIKSVEDSYTSVNTFFELPRDILASEKTRLSNFKEISNVIAQAESWVNGFTYPSVGVLDFKLRKPISISENAKNILLHYGNIESIWWSFDCNIPLFVNFGGREWRGQAQRKTSFLKKTMFNIPQKIKNSGVANFNFKYHDLDENNNWVSKNGKITLNSYGQDLNENNPLNPYDFSISGDSGARRGDLYEKYFNQNAVVLQFECLPNFELFTGDIVKVQSNYFYVGGDPIMYEGLLVSQTLTYNGAFRQKTIVHEVNFSVG